MKLKMRDKGFWILDCRFWIEEQRRGAVRFPLIQNPKSPAHKRQAMKIQNRKGFTLLEIIIVITVLSILTAAAIPMVRNSVRRQREEELRIALRQLRQAIDRYRDYYDRNPAAIPLELQTTETRL